MKTLSEHKRSFLAVIDDMTMMMLAIVSALLLLLEIIEKLTPAQLHIVERVDLVIALIFLAEFIVRFAISSHKTLFIKKFWWELLAAIPVTSEFVQALRILRLLRLSRLAVHVKMLAKDGEGVEEWRIT